MDHQRADAQVFLAHFHAGIGGMERLQILLIVLYTALAVVCVDALHTDIVAPVLTEGGGLLVLGLLHPNLLELLLVEALGMVVGMAAHDVANLHHIGHSLDELLIGEFLFHCVFHCVGLLS